MTVRRWTATIAAGFLVLAAVLPLVGIEGSGALLLPVGILLLCLALVLGFRRLMVEREPTTFGTPERLRSAPTPGEDFDEEIEALRGTGGRQFGRDQLRERLRTLAEDLLAQRGLHEDALDARIRSGGWTDDGVAAGFLRGDDLPRRSLRERLRTPFGTNDGFVTALDRTVAELSRIAGIEPSDREDEEQLPGQSRSATEGTRETHHWRGIAALGVATLAVGVLTETPSLVLASTAGAGYAAYARLGRAPDPTLTVERTLSETEPDPGEDVTVTLTVRNEGKEPVSDCRIVDGVPADVAVVSGTPRGGVVLPPGATTHIEYAVRARRGVHEFEPAWVCLRPVSETVERIDRVGSTTKIVCRPRLDSPPDAPGRQRTTRFTGQVRTATGGRGLAFHSVREYRRGDSPTRIDWKRLARSGELATVTYTEERAGRLVVAVDTREAVRVASASGEPTAKDRGVSAAGDLFAAFTAEADTVGLVAVGAELCWLQAHEASIPRVRELLTRHPAFGSGPSGGSWYLGDWLDEFRRRFQRPAHVVFCSPLCDSGSATLTRYLVSYGYPVTVVSPDPTTARTLGERIARLERAVRLGTLRDAGVHTVDWKRDEPLAAALARAETRWSR